MPETTFDTLNLKAALFAIEKYFEDFKLRLPVIASITITDASGRTLSGQTVEACWISISHAPLLAVGINCALGAAEMRPHIEELASLAPCYLSCYPNAGLPNALGEYDQTPAQMAELLRDFASNNWLNLVGGCCGTTPDFIREIANVVKSFPPRVPPRIEPHLRLSGLEPLVVRDDSNFIVVGERTNVTGSPKFAQLVKADDLEPALAIARQQIDGGANILDVNMDEGLLDSEKVMAEFLNLVASEPEISRVPLMIDSSKWSVIESGLKRTQGKSVVNSISLKEGEAKFREQATLVKRYGAAVIVMAAGRVVEEVGDGDRRCGCRRNRCAVAQPAGRGAPMGVAGSSSTRSASIRPTSSSIRTSSPSPPGWKSTTTTASHSSSRCASCGGSSRWRTRRAGSATSRSHSAATKRYARRCTPRFSITPSAPD